MMILKVFKTMTRKAQVLILDDEPALINKAIQSLYQDYDFHLAHTIDQAKKFFQEHSEPDIALVDLQLHHEIGSNFLFWLKQERPSVVRVMMIENPDLLFLSKVLDQELIHRFFEKPLNSNTLSLHLKECHLFAQTLSQSRTDRMTGLLNKASFQERLKVEFDRSLRHERPLSMILVDLDHLKKINDLKGHLEGDLWIQTLGKQILSCVRLIDFVGRWGGDEFGILLPDTRLEEARFVAERLQDSIKDEFHGEITLSIGISQTLHFQQDSERLLLSRADQALYRAKEKGRNIVEVQE